MFIDLVNRPIAGTELYNLGTKFRDEARPRGGLIRVRTTQPNLEQCEASVRADVAEAHPWLPRAVFEAYSQAKRLAYADLETTTALKVTLCP